jgi:hypothetical protein
MAGAHERTLTLPRRSAALDDARRFAEGAVGSCTPECREAVTLAVCELGENLIKYSASPDELDAGTIAVCVEDDRVRIRAINRVASTDDARAVTELVAQITSSDIRELYRARLQELFRDPSLPRAKLGLLRMAFEGGFRLSCSVDAAELQIIAERSCGRAA